MIFASTTNTINVTDYTTDRRFKLLGALLKSLSGLDFQEQLEVLQQLFLQLENQQLDQIIQAASNELDNRQKALTRLMGKRDYKFYQKGKTRQVYIYVRRRQRQNVSCYLGELFLIPEGHAYQFCSSPDGGLLFPENNIFRLSDPKTGRSHVIKLLKLDPPPPDYDIPDPGSKEPIDLQLKLHLELLNPVTLQPQDRRFTYFPTCMHGAGQLSQSVWQVEVVAGRVASRLAVPVRRQLSVHPKLGAAQTQLPQQQQQQQSSKPEVQSVVQPITVSRTKQVFDLSRVQLPAKSAPETPAPCSSAVRKQ